jgi:hypothetical protein
MWSFDPGTIIIQGVGFSIRESSLLQYASLHQIYGKHSIYHCPMHMIINIIIGRCSLARGITRTPTPWRIEITVEQFRYVRRPRERRAQSTQKAESVHALV